MEPTPFLRTVSNVGLNIAPTSCTKYKSRLQYIYRNSDRATQFTIVSLHHRVWVEYNFSVNFVNPLQALGCGGVDKKNGLGTDTLVNKCVPPQNRVKSM